MRRTKTHSESKFNPSRRDMLTLGPAAALSGFVAGAAIAKAGPVEPPQMDVGAAILHHLREAERLLQETHPAGSKLGTIFGIADAGGVMGWHALAQFDGEHKMSDPIAKFTSERPEWHLTTVGGRA